MNKRILFVFAASLALVVGWADGARRSANAEPVHDGQRDAIAGPIGAYDLLMCPTEICVQVPYLSNLGLCMPGGCKLRLSIGKCPLPDCEGETRVKVESADGKVWQELVFDPVRSEWSFTSGCNANLFDAGDFITFKVISGECKLDPNRINVEWLSCLQ